MTDIWNNIITRTDGETINYHSDVLETKIVLGVVLIVSVGSEFIENNGEDAQR